MTRFLLVCAVVLFGANAVLADTNTKPSSLPTNPAELVRWLGSDSYKDRARAADVLEKYSNKVIPILEKGLQSPDPEIRKRCRLLLFEAYKTPEQRKMELFIRTGKGSPTGWSAFSKTVGKDEIARRMFLEIYHADKNTITTLEKDKSGAKKLLEEWVNKISRRPYPNIRNGNIMQTRKGEVAALLYSALVANIDTRTTQRMYSIFYRPDVRRHFDNRSLLRPLLIKVLRRFPNTTRTLSYRINIARNVGVTDELRKDIEPLLLKQIKSAVKNSNNLNELSNIANYASQLGMSKAVKKELIPAVEKLAKQAANKPNDINAFYRIVSVANRLEMEQTLQKVLKPAFRKLVAKQGNTTNRLYQFTYMARILDVEKETNTVLRKHFEKRLQKVMIKPNQNDITRLLNESRSIPIPYDLQGYLKPAALEVVYSELAKGANLSRIQSLSYLIQQCGLGEVSNTLILPYVLTKAKTIQLDAKNVDNFQQLVYAAQRLGIQQRVLQEMKPRLTKFFQELGKQPIEGRYPRLLGLVRNLKLKEAVPYALKVAESSRVYSGYRGQALQYVGKNGDKNDIEKLKKLLKDTSSVGSITINGTPIKTQVRDAALATMVHLSGKTLRDFGFDYARRFGTGYLNTSYSCYGFTSEKSRAAAFKKWNDFQKTQEVEGGRQKS